MLVLFNFLMSINIFNLDVLSSLSEQLHFWCIQRVDQSHPAQADIYLALLCGKRLPAGDLRDVFTQAGLIHLMVVSGAHLIFLEKMWTQLPHWPFKNVFIVLSLILYTLMAGLHPPVFRALVSFFIYRFSKVFHLFWSPYWRIMLSGALSLMFNPAWITSISLQMSLIGALGFASSRYSKLLSCVLCYILLLPVLSQWTSLHPLTAGVNWIFYPLISVTLFPLSVLSFIFPFCYQITSYFWIKLIQFLQLLQPFLEQTPFYVYPIQGYWVWLYIGLIFVVNQGVLICCRKS